MNPRVEQEYHEELAKILSVVQEDLNRQETLDEIFSKIKTTLVDFIKELKLQSVKHLEQLEVANKNKIFLLVLVCAFLTVRLMINNFSEFLIKEIKVDTLRQREQVQSNLASEMNKTLEHYLGFFFDEANTDTEVDKFFSVYETYHKLIACYSEAMSFDEYAIFSKFENGNEQFNRRFRFPIL